MPKTRAEFEDELKAAKRRIEELREEIDEQRELITELRQNAEDTDNLFDNWEEAFDLVPDGDGNVTMAPLWDEHNALVDDFNDVVRRWNKFLPLINGKPRNVGRPLAASEAQVIEVERLRRDGRSLRGIAEDTSLGLDTVRTIVGKMSGDDRTMRKHRARLERVEIDRVRQATWKRQCRIGKELPRRIKRVRAESQALVKRARGG
jgi:hypothetical protein